MKENQKTIDYDKYSTMSIRQLISALTNAEKKQAKIKERLEKEINQVKELIAYLKSQVKTSLDKPRLYSTENAPSIQKIQKYENENQELAEQARAELNKELESYANENNIEDTPNQNNIEDTPKQNNIKKTKKEKEQEVIIETLKFIFQRKNKLNEIAVSDFTKKFKQLTGNYAFSNEDFRKIFKNYLIFKRKNRVEALTDKAIKLLNTQDQNTK